MNGVLVKKRIESRNLSVIQRSAATKDLLLFGDMLQRKKRASG